MRPRTIALATTIVCGCSFSQTTGLGGGGDLVDTGAPAIDSTLDEGVPRDADDSGSAVAEDVAAEADHADDVGDASEVEADAPCPPPTAASACDGVGKLLAPQLVDGDDAEFACIPETTYTVDAAPVQVPSGAGAGLPEVVHIRVGWSTAGLGVFVHVEDPSVVVVPADHAALFDGDAVEIFVSGVSTLTGLYDGVHDPAASQIVVAPPAGGIDARARLYQYDDKGPIDPSLYASKLVSDGYVVEVGLSWAFLKGGGLVGSKIGFDVALDVDDDPSMPTTRQVWAGYVMKTVAGKSSCGTGSLPYLWCDDRSWCTPTME